MIKLKYQDLETSMPLNELYTLLQTSGLPYYIEEDFSIAIIGYMNDIFIEGEIVAN